MAHRLILGGVVNEKSLQFHLDPRKGVEEIEQDDDVAYYHSSVAGHDDP